MKTAFLFPGQGAQRTGMLHELDVTDPIVAEVFTQTASILSIPLDTAEKLQSTLFVQVNLLIAGVISARQLLHKGVHPDFVAGHSVGAFAAAVASGVLDFPAALQLVYNRGKLMEQAYPTGYGMAAIVGFSLSAITQFIQAHNERHAPVYLANINTADQQVIAGATASLQILIATLQANGARKAQLLPVSVPSHCVLLDGVAAELKQQISTMQLQEPAIPYCANSTGRLLTTAAAIREDLWQSVAMPLKWYDGITLLSETGVNVFIEMQPGGVLGKMTQSAFPEAVIIDLGTDSADTAAWRWHHYLVENSDH